MKFCKRCGAEFRPRLLKSIRQFSTCCETCGVRNILDGLGMPTPPELLDRHTRRPALTTRAFYDQLDKARKR